MDSENRHGTGSTDPPRREISLQEYIKLVEKLIDVVEKECRPDHVVGIASGGLIPALCIAKNFDVQLAVMAVQSYKAGDSGFNDCRGKLRFGRDIAAVDPDLSGKVLLVDDLTDSGTTLEYSVDWLNERYGKDIAELRTAVVWHKACSVWIPDFCAAVVEPDVHGNYPWIIQPFEKYEKGRG